MRSYRVDGNHVDTANPGALLATDRCDRCGAQAVHRYLFAAGELMLCGHHAREHKDRLPQATTAAASGRAGE